MPALASPAQQRYQAAVAYVRRAIAQVDRAQGWLPSLFGRKTETARGDLARIEARWRFAASEAERDTIARDAELLADRVQESVPGAPQDRARTNLFPGEVQTYTPATSYLGEVAGELGFGSQGNKERSNTLLWVGGLVAVAGISAVAARNRRRRQ